MVSALCQKQPSVYECDGNAGDKQQHANSTSKSEFHSRDTELV